MAARKTAHKAPEALDPLERHAQLVAELEHIQELADADEVEAAKLRAAECPGHPTMPNKRGPLLAQQTESDLAQARVALIRGTGTQAEVERLEAKREEVEKQIRQLQEREAARSAARQAVWADIEALVEEELPAFVAEARRLSEVAHEALGELTKDDRLARAHATWQEAASYWQRLGRTHNGSLPRDFVSHRPVPPFPMPPVAQVIGAKCLPEDVIIADAAGDELGTTIRWVDRLDHIVEAPAGSREAQHLDQSPHYRRA
jgi:hypothetical protein